MTTTTGVTAKLFLGIYLVPDYKTKLLKSKPWKESQLEANTTRKITIVDHENKEYLGMYVEKPTTMNEMKMNILYCLNQYKQYLPDIHIEVNQLTIFPQIFIY